jgi:hypothetical protein
LPDIVITAIDSNSLMRNDKAFTNFNTLSSSKRVNKCVSESSTIPNFGTSLIVVSPDLF